MSVAFLCPGQGAQRPGLLRELPEDPEVARTLAEARGALGRDPGTLDTPEALASTVAVQVATVLAGVAVGRALLRRGVDPRAVAGLSVGAYTAAVLAGALPLPDALRLVGLRAERMERAFPRGYGLAAIVGLGEGAVARIVADSTSPAAPVHLANVNGPTQLVIAGADAGLDRAIRSALSDGAQRAERLPVAVPSHCDLLRPVADALREAFREVPLAPPSAAYVTSRGRATLDPEAIREDLAGNVERPVRWHDATDLLFETGTRLFVELPPGRTLTSLAESAFPDARAVAASETSLDGIAALAAREARLERAR